MLDRDASEAPNEYWDHSPRRNTMGMRQPNRLSARPVYGFPGVAVADERSDGTRGTVLTLLILVVALAVATVWYVGLPALDGKPRAERSCEVVVLASGATKCVRDPMRGSRTAPQKPTGRTKH